LTDNAWTERYLAVVLRQIPERQRADVERELRSSIGDAIDDRAAAGEGRDEAERAVLEGLGDPVRLAAGMTGKPMYLIGPDLFPTYRQLLITLLSVVVPIVGIVMGVLELVNQGTIGDAIITGGGAALNVAVHLAFWFTLVFAIAERVDAAKNATQQATGGPWKLERLPKLPTDRITIGEMAGEIITLLFTIGGLIVVQNLTWTESVTGQVLPLLEPALVNFWLPVLIAVLASLVIFHLVVFAVGRWTMPLAVVHTVLELAFALPVAYLALNGLLVNPAFAAAVGYPPLAEGDGPVMIILAASVAIITAWEIFDGFRRARRSDMAASTGTA